MTLALSHTGSGDWIRVYNRVLPASHGLGFDEHRARPSARFLKAPAGLGPSHRPQD